MVVTPARILSLVVAVGYVAAAYLRLPGFDRSGLDIYFVLVSSLALIWFSDELGETRGISMDGNCVDRESPGWLVAAIGWIWLFGYPFVPYLREVANAR